jgi:transcriptional regulator with XRE-family HTH domain
MLTKEELGRRLRMARFERGMTLKDVAARCGMSATHISEVERGKTSPTVGALQRISRALGVKSSSLVRETRVPLSKFTRFLERTKIFVADRDGKPLEIEILSPGIPGGLMQLLRRTSAPGETVTTPRVIGEVVLLCTKGMVRITSEGGESFVLREGDTLQRTMDDGYTETNIGEDAAEVMAIFVSPSLLTI